MAVRSMTGYGRAQVEESGTRIAVEVRSVNSRYLDLVVRLPRELQSLEGRLKEIVQERIDRGRVSLGVTWEGATGARTSVTLDEELSESYFTALSQLKERFRLEGAIDIATMASLPELLRFAQAEWELEDVQPLVERATRMALDDLVRMKGEEGELLAMDLRRRAETLRDHLARVLNRMPLRVEEGAQTLRERLARLLGDRELPAERLAAEVVILAERLDCTEECVRFGIHIDQFLKYLNEEGNPGRRLNFLLQEMGREANTMSTKANDAQVSHEVVQVKDELEKMREQVQNVE